MQKNPSSLSEHFPTDLTSIEERISYIDPLHYARSRNYLHGGVTCVSPYVSRGVIGTRKLMLHLHEKKYSFEQAESLLMELAWRDYFQRVWQEKEIDQDLLQEQQGVQSHEIPLLLMEGKTGIQAIDAAIARLYSTGYMHNHLRMYVAALACNQLGCHWLAPARWMYFHLLDGDWASNACSWQWVAGANSKKKYRANQENINRFTGHNQTGTFLDVDYETLETVQAPVQLLHTALPSFATALPSFKPIDAEVGTPVAVYTCYNLDPEWLKEKKMTRILLFDTELLSRYPMGPATIAFILSLSKNIPGIQYFAGTFAQLQEACNNNVLHFKEHPSQKNYSGIVEEREWMVPEVSGYYPSFFAYRKRILPFLQKQFM